jgi:formylmethanofuran dehydrogenase subunit E
VGNTIDRSNPKPGVRNKGGEKNKKKEKKAEYVRRRAEKRPPSEPEGNREREREQPAKNKNIKEQFFVLYDVLVLLF